MLLLAAFTWRRKPIQEVIVGSEQGSLYGSDDWKRFCDDNKLLPSMSQRGNYWDSAVARSFFGSLKNEWICKSIYKTRVLARADVFNYIETFYTRTRRRSYLGGVSPEELERTAIWGLSLSAVAGWVQAMDNIPYGVYYQNKWWKLEGPNADKNRDKRSMTCHRKESLNHRFVQQKLPKGFTKWPAYLQIILSISQT